ncbi:hypothetical protein NKG05_15710 [Oerskovia sp. M15]
MGDAERLTSGGPGVAPGRGRIALNIVDRRPLHELPAVHDDSASGKLAGKTVLTVG